MDKALVTLLAVFIVFIAVATVGMGLAVANNGNVDYKIISPCEGIQCVVTHNGVECWREES